MSTLMFADFAHQIDGELHSCDISKKNIENAKDFTRKFARNTFFYHKDSIEFLKILKKNRFFISRFI